MIREEAVRLPFRYAAGTGAGRFLAALADRGVLTGARCRACRRTWCPAREFCPRCGSDLADPVAVGPGGQLLAWTRVGDTTFGLVQPDGADGALVHHLLGEVDWTSGERVRVSLAKEHAGGILAIAGFEREAAGGPA